MGNVNIVRQLLEAGANIDCAALDGATPIHIAARQRNVEVASILLQAKAKVDPETRRHFASLLMECNEDTSSTIEDETNNGKKII